MTIRENWKRNEELLKKFNGDYVKLFEYLKEEERQKDIEFQKQNPDYVPGTSMFDYLKKKENREFRTLMKNRYKAYCNDDIKRVALKERTSSVINSEIMSKCLEQLKEERTLPKERGVLFLIKDGEIVRKIIKEGRKSECNIPSVELLDEHFDGIVKAHNHPDTKTDDYSARPSINDCKSVFETIGRSKTDNYTYYDDIIVWSDGYYSFREHSFILDDRDDWIIKAEDDYNYKPEQVKSYERGFIEGNARGVELGRSLIEEALKERGYDLDKLLHGV